MFKRLDSLLDSVFTLFVHKLLIYIGASGHMIDSRVDVGPCQYTYYPAFIISCLSMTKAQSESKNLLSLINQSNLFIVLRVLKKTKNHQGKFRVEKIIVYGGLV